MAIVNKLQFTRKQLKDFAKLFHSARIAAKMSQLQVAQEAFGYKLSHCKVSRIEREAMPKVDALAIEHLARVFGIPRSVLVSIDEKFAARAAITQAASSRGFWGYHATMV